MRGSIAVWQDTFAVDADGYEPRVEVHVNIWRNSRRHRRDHFDLFDIGFRFEELRALRALSISLPFEVGKSQVSDLFEVMHESSTLSAIFNDSLTPGSMLDGGHCFSACRTESKKVQFFVWRCAEEERQLSTIDDESGQSTVITLSDQIFERLKSQLGDHYLRLRIKIPTDTDNGFVSIITHGTRFSLARFRQAKLLSFVSTNSATCLVLYASGFRLRAAA